MNKEQKDYAIEVFKAIPSSITIAFGGLLGVVIGGNAILGQALGYLNKRNKEWFEQYVTEIDILSLIDDERKSAESLQFLRETIQKVAFETREEKRKRLLNIAINFHKKKEYKFDEKFRFLQTLDKLSEDELLFFLKIYSEDKPLHKAADEEKELIFALTSYGLLQMDFSKIQSAMNKVGNDLNSISSKLKEGGKVGDVLSGFSNIHSPRFNPLIDRTEIIYDETEFGWKFYDFLQIDFNKRDKKPKIEVSKVTDFV